jgi:hypothetical protein
VVSAFSASLLIGVNMKIKILKYKKISDQEYKVGRIYDVDEKIGKQLVDDNIALSLGEPEKKSFKIKLENKAIEAVEEDKKEEPKEEIEDKKEVRKKTTKRKIKK